jgi:hypothetical protein
MNISKTEYPCARLSPDVYKKLNLVDTGFSEFHFNKMKEMKNLPGMDLWPRTIEGVQTKFLFSLVCFLPPTASTSSQRQSMHHSLAHKLSVDMLHLCFPEKDDHSSINTAMNNFPCIAIFMALKDKKSRKRKLPKTKSIFDYSETCCCLAVANYFQHKQQTQVLWLATTLVEPPPESIHVMWHKCGLATYLLSILVMQHSGIGDGSLENSIICMQASKDRQNPVRRFYLKLGLACYDLPDNGLSETSHSFQRKLTEFPHLWISADREKMSLFKLQRGHLHTPQCTVDLTMAVSPIKPSWKTYGYSRFPYQAKSMKVIESFVEFSPILKFLSLDRLPLTDRPLMTARSASTMSGLILGEKRVSLNTSSWLRTDEIQFLLAFLTRNQESSFFHILGPSITHTLSELYVTMPLVMRNKATDEDLQAHKTNFDVVIKYIDSRLDVLEQKFLVFICNVGRNHWVSVVVVNPFLISGPFLKGDDETADNVSDEDSLDDDLCGWCVFDSLRSNSEEKSDQGFHGTFHTKLDPSLGVRLFLNLCASYLKSRKCEENNEGEADEYEIDYEEPFGDFSSSKQRGDEFFRFDYTTPNIILQQNSDDCGFASVANAMAFVLHMRSVRFSDQNLDLYDPSEHEPTMSPVNIVTNR